MDHEEQRDQLTELFEGIRAGENLVAKLKARFKAIMKDEPEEFYEDMNEDFSLWINDADWREDYVGDEAIQDGGVSSQRAQLVQLEVGLKIRFGMS